MTAEEMRRWAWRKYVETLRPNVVRNVFQDIDKVKGNVLYAWIRGTYKNEFIEVVW